MRTANVMALDVGKVRIGVALSDALGITAQPLLTVHRKSRGDDLRNLVRLAHRHDASRILVGNPLHLSGDQSSWSLKVLQFAQELATRTRLPVELVDERLSTRAAHELLDQAHYNPRDRKQIIDQVAAVVILNTWMLQQPTVSSANDSSSPA